MECKVEGQIERRAFAHGLPVSGIEIQFITCTSVREKCSVFTHCHKLVGLHPLVCVWVYDVELAGGLGLVCWGWDVAGTHCLSGWVSEYKGITAYGLAH